MNKLLLLALTAIMIFPTPLQSDTNHFLAGGVFELDLGNREIPLTPKQERVKAFRRSIKKEKDLKVV